MVTEQVMERKFYDGMVRQNHKTSWLNANDILDLGNRYRESVGLPKTRLQKFMEKKSTKEFIEQILDEERLTKVTEARKGQYGGTWMHPLLFLDFAMFLNPKFKYEAMKWLTDKLLENRDESGNSYRAMTGSLQDNYDVGARLGVIVPQIATKIKTKLGVTDWNKASEEQLKNRDKIHNSIILLAQAKVAIDKNVEIALNSVDIK